MRRVRGESEFLWKEQRDEQVDEYDERDDAGQHIDPIHGALPVDWALRALARARSRSKPCTNATLTKTNPIISPT
jgi:hypothetical protein